MRQACGWFLSARLATEAGPSEAYPKPSPLIVDYCHLPRLNLTFAFVPANGLSTTWLQRNESLQGARFREIEGLLRRMSPPWYGGPTFVVFGGMEWEMKNWRCEYPKSRAQWQLPLASLHMQMRHLRQVWARPGEVRGVFTRTMFTPTYGNFGCSCCANESHFRHFNHLLRQAARPEVASAYDEHLAIQIRAGGNGSVSGDAGVVGRPGGREGVCAPMHVLDLQRIMLCNNTVGSCSGRSGWSIDGLHPSKAVYMTYLSLALNVASDLGEYCSGHGHGGHGGGGGHLGGHHAAQPSAAATGALLSSLSWLG